MIENKKNDLENLSIEDLLELTYNIKNHIFSLSKQLHDIERILVTKMRKNKQNKVYFDLKKTNEKIVAQLEYYFNKIVDYEKMKREYPKVYQEGLISVFSSKEAVKTLSPKIVGAIIQECMIKTPMIKLKYHKLKE